MNRLHLALAGAAAVLLIGCFSWLAWSLLFRQREPLIDRLTYYEAVLLTRAEEQRLVMMRMEWREQPEYARNNKQVADEHLANVAQQQARIELALWARREAWARENHLIPDSIRELQLRSDRTEPVR